MNMKNLGSKESEVRSQKSECKVPKQIVGIALHPSLASAVKEYANRKSSVSPHLVLFSLGFPILEDPRMADDECVVYYDRTAWMLRCVHQMIYDRKLLIADDSILTSES